MGTEYILITRLIRSYLSSLFEYRILPFITLNSV